MRSSLASAPGAIDSIAALASSDTLKQTYDYGAGNGEDYSSPIEPAHDYDEDEAAEEEMRPPPPVPQREPSPDYDETSQRLKSSSSSQMLSTFNGECRFFT